MYFALTFKHHMFSIVMFLWVVIRVSRSQTQNHGRHTCSTSAIELTCLSSAHHCSVNQHHPAQRFSCCQIISLYKSSLCCGWFMCWFPANAPTASCFSAVRPCRRAQRPDMCLVPMGSAANALLVCSYFKHFTCETRWRGFPGGDSRYFGKNQRHCFQSKWTFVVETLEWNHTSSLETCVFGFVLFLFYVGVRVL